MLLALLLLATLLASSNSLDANQIGGCHVRQDIISYRVTKSQTKECGICLTEQLFKQTGQMLNIAIVMHGYLPGPPAGTTIDKPSVLHFNATGFAEFRGEKLILMIASTKTRRYMKLHIEDVAALKVPLELFHNFDDGYLSVESSQSGQPTLIHRVTDSLDGLLKSRQKMKEIRPKAYLGSVIVIPYTMHMPEARFSRVPGRYDDPPLVASEAGCTSKPKYVMQSPLLNHFGLIDWNPKPVQLFDSHGPMAEPFCRLDSSTGVIALHFINGQPSVGMATIVVRLVGANSTLALLADTGAGCPRQIRLMADRSPLAPPTTPMINSTSAALPSLTVWHNCKRNLTKIWAEASLLEALGGVGGLEIAYLPGLKLRDLQPMLLRNYIIRDSVMGDELSEITFEVQFNQWAYAPELALRTYSIVSSLTPDSSLIYLEKSVLNNATHRLTNLTIGHCRLYENATHYYRLLPIWWAALDIPDTACGLRRLDKTIFANLTASVQLQAGINTAGQFNLSVPVSWTVPALANRRLLMQSRRSSVGGDSDSGANPILTGSAVPSIADRFQFKLAVRPLGGSGGPRIALELQSTRPELLYSGELIDCSLNYYSRPACPASRISVPLVSNGCTAEAQWLGPGVAAPLLILQRHLRQESLPSNDDSGACDNAEVSKSSAIASCRVAVCHLAGPESVGLTVSEADAIGIRQCRRQGDACADAVAHRAVRNGVHLALTPQRLLVSLKSDSLPLDQILLMPAPTAVELATTRRAAAPTNATPEALLSPPPPVGLQALGSVSNRVDQSAKMMESVQTPLPTYQLWSHLLASVLAFLFGVGTTASMWAIVSGWRRYRRRRPCRCNSGGGSGDPADSAKSSAQHLLSSSGGGGGNVGGGGGGHSGDSSSGFYGCGNQVKGSNGRVNLEV